MFKASLEKTSYPFVVKHVEKQPQEVAKQDQSVRERNPLKVRSEIRLIMNISFFCNTSYNVHFIINPLCAFTIPNNVLYEVFWPKESVLGVAVSGGEDGKVVFFFNW